MSKGTKLFVYIMMAIVVILLVYGYGDSRGYKAGLLQGSVVSTVKKNKKIDQTKAQQEEARKKIMTQAATKAAKESNPFKTIKNDVNPLIKAKKVLNPFD